MIGAKKNWNKNKYWINEHLNFLEQHNFSNTSLLDKKVLILLIFSGNDLDVNCNTFSQLRKKTLFRKNALLFSWPVNPFLCVCDKVQTISHDITNALWCGFWIIFHYSPFIACASTIGFCWQFHEHAMPVLASVPLLCSSLHLSCLSPLGKHAA